MNPSPEEVSSTSEVYDASDEASSDAECFSRTLKNPNASKKSFPYSAMYPSPKEADTATAEYDNLEIHRNVFGNVPFKKTENSGLEISSTEKSKIENIKKDGTQFDKTSVGNIESSQKEAIDPSLDKVSTSLGATSETRDTGASSYVVVEMFEDSPEDVAAEALMLEYMNKYANEYSKELLFAVDLMTLVRYLNEFEIRYIIYGTSGNAPISPCDDTLDQALRIMWETLKEHRGPEFESVMKEKKLMNYHRFQEMMLYIAKTEEDSKWCDEKAFLTYCLMLAECAVYAERNGLKNAHEFIPLVICRTIQKLKDSGQFPVDFWERLPKFALQITNGFERPS